VRRCGPIQYCGAVHLAMVTISTAGKIRIPNVGKL
jgi:hypothetical protein